MKLSGGVELAAGTYTMRVSADDGYQIKVDGVVVAIVDNNQSSSTNDYYFTVSGSGTHSIEIVYWDQGGDYQLVVKLADESGNYAVLGSSSYPTTAEVTADIPNGVTANTFFEGVASSLDSDLAWFESNTGIEDTSPDYLGNDKFWHDDSKGSLITGSSNEDVIYGNDGDDHIKGMNSGDTLIGGSGSDWLEGGEGEDTLYGGDRTTADNSGSSSDRLDGGNGQDRLYGGGGDDFLLGGGGDDKLYGGDGNDVLIGGQGQDTMTGGTGQDLFILTNDGVDTITDFNAKEDALDISDLLMLPSDVNSADQDAVTAYLNDQVTINKDGKMSVDNKDVANFGSASKFDSNGVDGVTTADSIRVIYNDQEYNINIDG